DSSATLTMGGKVLTAGSTSAVDAIYTTLTDSRTFSASGGLGSSTGSFADYAAEIISNVASKATSAATTYTSKTTIQSTFASAMSSQSGVNLDRSEEHTSELQSPDH